VAVPAPAELAAFTFPVTALAIARVFATLGSGRAVA
jgi:hypothetical protein